ncbi:FkbM family methyltransferase [Nonomuraea sp. SYSU D8015]|uniref:FkbM family methyltransferase n=1 Tax=Nonomuraea sp. SYSU D8015 TaxID=2593644 RepID=UPI001660BA0D|nr:FkbM family methyltransferase [Nonomuraea sp. SYSU D8015]
MTDPTPRDGPVLQGVWRLLRRLPPGAARRTTRLIAGAQSLREPGYLKTTYRISPRLANANPRLGKISPQWAATVRVRRNGLRLELDLRDNLQAILYYAGRYEPDVLRFLRRELRGGDVVADVGAHIGVHALAAARLLRPAGGRVIAFEPASDSAAKLRAAARRNGLRVEVVQTALGAHPGTAGLYGDARYDAADAGVRSQYGDAALVEQVPVRVFDDWAAEAGLSRLDVVKIDVEGAEAAVLAGMSRSLRTLRPRAVLVEVKQRERTDTSAEELRGLLTRHGYERTMRLGHNEVFRPTRDHGPR